jgi:hypothetical protein
MHDMDRTRTEYGEQESEQFEYPGETEFAESVGEAFEAGFNEAEAGEGAYEGGYETGYETGYEAGYETGYESEVMLSEADELELASELLEVTNEQELDRFLGKLVSRAVKGIGKVVKSPIGRALGGVLKKAAKVALPIAGRAAGAFFGGPAGAMIGGQLASTAGRMFGLELEGLSSEDAEWEVARRYVRFASSAASRAASAPSSAAPQVAARSAAIAAARRHAPGLLKVLRPQGQGAPGQGNGSSGAGISAGGRRGNWYHRDRRIVLVGV